MPITLASAPLRLLAPAVLLALVAGLSPARADEYPVLAIGSSAPDFNLPGIDGKNHPLAEYRTKVLVLIFTSNHCPTAQNYQGRVQELYDHYQGKDVSVVAINPNNNRALTLDELAYSDLGDSLPEMKIRAEDIHITYPYLYAGETQDVPRAYGPRVTPHAFVFDAARKLRYEGRIDDNERPDLVKVHDLTNAIDDLLAGREVAVPTTPTAGCSTKWLYKSKNVDEWNAKVAAEPVSLEMADEAALSALHKNDSGKLRLITFWNTTCIPCIAELPDLVNINRTYRIRSFELVTVSTNFPDQKDAALQVLTHNQCACRNLIFASTDTYKNMAAFDPNWDGATPYTVLLAPGGKVLLSVTGTVDLLALKRAIVKNLK